MDYNDGSYFNNDGFYRSDPISFEETEIGDARQLTTVHEQPLSFKNPRGEVVEPAPKKRIEPFGSYTKINWNMIMLFLVVVVFAMQIHVMATMNTFIALSNRRP